MERVFAKVLYVGRYQMHRIMCHMCYLIKGPVFSYMHGSPLATEVDPGALHLLPL